MVHSEESTAIAKHEVVGSKPITRSISSLVKAPGFAAGSRLCDGQGSEVDELRRNNALDLQFVARGIRQ
jgi:hypothetical protein